MIVVSELESQFAALLPDTHALLRDAHLTVHAGVSRITLHGSRGLQGGYRPDSDVDMCLLVNAGALTDESALDRFLREVLETTLTHWRGSVEPDLAAIYDTMGCGLRCFEKTRFDESACERGGVDCFGLFKIQKGANGFVAGAGVQVKRMYPCLTIWRNEAHT